MNNDLVELCAGSAAVSIAAASGRVPPPILATYLGGKRRHAAEILRHADLAPLWPVALHLVEAGEAALWLEAVADPDRRARVVEIMRSWPGQGAALYLRLRGGPVPVNPDERAAVGLALQSSTVLGKPVSVRGWAWSTAGYADLSPSAVRLGFTDRLLPGRLADRVGEVGRCLAGASGVTVSQRDAREVPPFAARAVYLDPPYVGVTGYPHALDRADVVRVALAWREAGARRVLVSEHDPITELVDEGAEVVLLGGDAQDGRWAQSRREVLHVLRGSPDA